jgi:hypothetical protein
MSHTVVIRSCLHHLSSAAVTYRCQMLQPPLSPITVFWSFTISVKADAEIKNKLLAKDSYTTVWSISSHSHKYTTYILALASSFCQIYKALKFVCLCPRLSVHKVLTYVEYRAVSGVFQNIDPPTPLSTPAFGASSKILTPPPPSPPAFGAGGGHTRRAVRGWGVNILEDARHRIGILQYNLSTLSVLYLHYEVYFPQRVTEWGEAGCVLPQETCVHFCTLFLELLSTRCAYTPCIYTFSFQSYYTVCCSLKKREFHKIFITKIKIDNSLSQAVSSSLGISLVQ